MAEKGIIPNLMVQNFVASITNDSGQVVENVISLPNPVANEKPKRESILDLKYPLTDITILAKIIGKPLATIGTAIRKVGVFDRSMEIEDVYRILCFLNNMENKLTGQYCGAEKRKQIIIDHIKQIESV